MKSKKTRIIYVNEGVANRFDNCIEIHKDLKKYPSLLNPIIEHELSHTTNVFSVKDLVIDFSSYEIPTMPLIFFMIPRPSTWVQFLPVYRHKKRGWVYDINLSIFYGLIALTIVSAFVFF